MNKKIEATPLSDCKLTQASNEAAWHFAKNTEHIALNADTVSAETIIHNMRGMAYSIGFEAGAKWLLQEAKKQKDDPDYKDGGYRIGETLISLDRLIELVEGK